MDHYKQLTPPKMTEYLALEQCSSMLILILTKFSLGLYHESTRPLWRRRNAQTINI